LEDPQIKECWALENLQPLLKADNRSKGNRWSDHPDDLAAGNDFTKTFFTELNA